MDAKILNSGVFESGRAFAD